MPCYLVIDGVKKEMEEDMIDQMVEALQRPTKQSKQVGHGRTTLNDPKGSSETRRNLQQETIR